MRRFNGTKFAAVALSAALALGTAACGGNGDDARPDSAAAASVASAPASQSASTPQSAPVAQNAPNGCAELRFDIASVQSPINGSWGVDLNVSYCLPIDTEVWLFDQSGSELYAATAESGMPAPIHTVASTSSGLLSYHDGPIGSEGDQGVKYAAVFGGGANGCSVALRATLKRSGTDYTLASTDKLPKGCYVLNDVKFTSNW